MRTFLLISALATSLAASNDSFYTSTISNSIPRTDTTGKIMDAHDSKVVYKDGLYHWFAASYGLCKEPAGNTGCAPTSVGACGFATDHNVTLFTSPDLVNWTDAGVVFSAAGNLPPNSVLFAPKTVWNPNTQHWVLWFNYIVKDFSKSYYGVATSKTSEGPFELAVAQVNTTRYSDNGDQNLFVDDDGTGYMLYTSIGMGHSVSVEQMTPDYLGTLGANASSGLIGQGGVEAPAMFKRGDLYYVAFGSCCCYCAGGANAAVYSATSPLGPYTERTMLGNPASQPTDIFGWFDKNGVQHFMYIGDHWQSAPDGLKGHDFTAWAPIHFSTDGIRITTNPNLDNFTITVKKGPKGE